MRDIIIAIIGFIDFNKPDIFILFLVDAGTSLEENKTCQRVKKLLPSRRKGRNILFRIIAGPIKDPPVAQKIIDSFQKNVQNDFHIDFSKKRSVLYKRNGIKEKVTSRLVR